VGRQSALPCDCDELRNPAVKRSHYDDGVHGVLRTHDPSELPIGAELDDESLTEAHETPVSSSLLLLRNRSCRIGS
jgi:hypothetical protein